MTATSDKVAAAVESLHDGITDLMASEGWIEYLDHQSRFHTYSANNVFLILIQRPDATRVAGFKTWKTMGRTVNKGEKGIAILAPNKRKVEDKETGDSKTILTGFRIAYVFDVAQTSGEPLPDAPVRLLDDDKLPDTIHAALVAQIEAAGYTYEDGDASESGSSGALGFTDFLDRRVVVGTNLRSQRVKTTAHELAHVLLHDPKSDDKTRPESRALCEVEAESVAYVVLHALGYDSGDYSFGYVASWSAGHPEVVETTAKRVGKCAGQVIDAITESMKEVAA